MAISENPSAAIIEPRQSLALPWAVARRRKAASLAIAIAIELLLLLLLLTLGTQFAGDEKGEAVTTFQAVEFAAPPAPEPETAEESAADTPQETQPVPDPPAPTPQRPSPLALSPQPAPSPPPPAPAQPQAQPSPAQQPPARPKIGARINPNRTYGPSDSGNPRMMGDSERVGTMPNGEPLYAARWYREPTDSELAGYLSTANGPGSALIACKTVRDYYVEDCVLLGESPPGSMMGRAVMAAAWQFRVRPARIGGQEQFGSWVRIRIDYTVRQRPR